MNKSLARRLFRRGLVTVAKPILWYGFFTAVILQYVVFGPYSADPRNPLMYAALAVILSVPFFARWVQDAFLCRPFTGRVERVEIRHRLQTNAAGAKYDRSRMLVTDHLYYIRTPRGKRLRFLIREPNFEYVRYFPVGCEIVHPFGAKYFERRYAGGDEVLCLVCGTLCRRRQTICYECRSPLSRFS